MKPILNIVTVTKDDLEGLAATIRSTRQLRAHPGVRQIIVDGSSAPIQNKVQDLLADEDNVDYLWQEANGIASAFNLGLREANGEWVWFLNGKDEVHPKLDPSIFMKILGASNGKILIYELEFMQSGLRYSHPPITALWPPVMFWVPHPATLIKRELFEKYGYFKEIFKIAMDGEIWFRFLSKDIVVDMLSMPIALYDEGGLSHSQSRETARESIRIIMSYFPMMLKMWMKNVISIITALRIFYRAMSSKLNHEKSYHDNA